MAGIMPPPVATPLPPRGPYEVIAAELRAEILAGRLAVGQELPTLVEIGSTHQVSSATAQRALQVLRSEGLIDVARGRRATVRDITADGSGASQRLA
jgi:integrase